MHARLRRCRRRSMGIFSLQRKRSLLLIILSLHCEELNHRLNHRLNYRHRDTHHLVRSRTSPRCARASSLARSLRIHSQLSCFPAGRSLSFLTCVALLVTVGGPLARNPPLMACPLKTPLSGGAPGARVDTCTRNRLSSFLLAQQSWRDLKGRLRR